MHQRRRHPDYPRRRHHLSLLSRLGQKGIDQRYHQPGHHLSPSSQRDHLETHLEYRRRHRRQHQRSL